ncbi:MAG TPA: isochorismatase [Micromonosporaceae bacterium]|nr:isochorismatase [Micromonosporaceae bacterium]HCU50553.1 isochorismatase [Micromonosporaceae bacterium]
MGLPAIPPYSLTAVLPENRVQWRPDPARAVLLVHDMQAWFLDRFAGPPLPSIMENISLLRKDCAALGIPVIFTAQPPRQDPHERALLTDFWGPGLPDDAAAALLLDPADDDIVLTKWRYSAFVRTGLEEALGGRDQLLIAGVYGHIGIVATACDAFMRDIQPFILADAVADFSAAHHEQALSWAAQRCAVVTATAMASLDLMLGFTPDDDENLLEAGLDSIRLMAVGERFGVSFMDLAEEPTRARWLTLIGGGR